MSEDSKVEVSERKRAIVMDYAKFNQLVLKNLKNVKIRPVALAKYSREQIMGFLDKPATSEKPLRDVSIALYNKSSHYKRLIQYFSNMPLLDFYVQPINIDFQKVNKKTLASQYKKVINFLDLMSIKHEFKKILKVAFREDIYYGYEHISNNSYFIQKLNPDYCQISSIEDGCYNFAFDFSYFASNLEQLQMYPKEFKTKYNAYLKNKDLRWQELDSSKTVCIKINEDLEYCIPPFAAVFEALFDIEDYKALRKDRQEISNYKVLVQKIPIREDSEDNNDLMLDMDHVINFHNKAAQALPDQVGLITTPMDVKDINFEKDSADADNVEKATRDYWMSAGVPDSLFNGGKAGIAGLEASIKTDEQIIFEVLRQIERWINRRLKFFISNTNFRVNILDITEQNKGDVFEAAFKASQFGYPTKMKAMAALGYSPSAVSNMAFLENDLLELVDKFIPLQSAHTDNGEEAGAPKKAASDLSDEGDRSRNE